MKSWKKKLNLKEKPSEFRGKENRKEWVRVKFRKAMKDFNPIYTLFPTDEAIKMMAKR